MIQLVCASANPHKVAEIQAIFDEAGRGIVELLPRPAGLDDVVEDADTLLGNARLKAAAVAAASAMPALADDTGLEVAALGGAPGVRTARFAGEHATDADNRRKLLAELTDVGDRRARFVTVAMVVWPDGRELAVEGVCDGTIATSERGDGGFGYDALFVPAEGLGLTFSEMGPDAKHAISHRGRALRALFIALAPR